MNEKKNEIEFLLHQYILFFLSKTKKKLTNRTEKKTDTEENETFSHRRWENRDKCYDLISTTDVGMSFVDFFSFSLLRWCFLLFELECLCFLWCFLCFLPFFEISSWVFSVVPSTTDSIFEERVVGVTIVDEGASSDCGCAGAGVGVDCSFFVRSSFLPRDRLFDRRRSRLKHNKINGHRMNQIVLLPGMWWFLHINNSSLGGLLNSWWWTRRTTSFLFTRWSRRWSMKEISIRDQW